MSHSNIAKFIDNDELIIRCKKNAKILCRELKINQPRIKLMDCQIKTAQEMGYKDWFHLYNTIKNKYLSCVENLEKDNEINPSLALLHELINLVIKRNVTHIHFETRKNLSTIKFRINGELEHYKDISYQNSIDFYQNLFLLVTKTLSFDLLNFQQIKTRYLYNNKNFHISSQSMPVYPEGFDLVLKIIELKNVEQYTNLKRLGYSQEQQDIIFNSIKEKNGLVVFAGTTSSGKNSTINNLLMHFNDYFSNSKKVYQIVDHYSINLKGISQVPIIIPMDYDGSYNPTINSMINCLKSDPDIISLPQFNKMNIQSFESLNNAINQCTIITNINASSALGIIERLYDFNFEPNTVAKTKFLSVLVYQSLLPVVCSHCSFHIDTLFSQHTDIKNKSKYLSFFKSLELKYKINSINHVKLRNHDGCSHCHNTGIVSRTACVEVIELDDNMRSYIRSNNLKELYYYWRKLSDNNLLSSNMTGKTIYENALTKMLTGFLDPLDICNSLGYLRY